MSANLKGGLGKTLRDVRQERNWTLADVSARTGIPTSTLSKVENGKLSLSYDKILQLSHGIEVDITRLFGAPQALRSAPDAALTNRRSVDRVGTGHFVQTSTYDHHYLATELLHKKLDPIIADLRVRTMEEFGDWVRHSGEEFAYVLEGEVILCTEIYAPLHLNAGDSVYFDSAMGHAYLAAGQGPSRILSVCTAGSDEPRNSVSARRPNGDATVPPAATSAPAVQRGRRSK